MDCLQLVAEGIAHKCCVDIFLWVFRALSRSTGVKAALGHRGGMECIERHWGMMFRPKYGRLGMVTLPLFLLCDLISPAAELVGYALLLLFVLLGWTNWTFFFTSLGLVMAIGVLISTMSLVLEQDEIERFRDPKDLWAVFFMAIKENFGYRQLCSFWRLKAFVEHYRGVNQGWGTMVRKGFNTKTAA